MKADIAGTIFKLKRFSIHDGPGIRTSVFLKGCPLNCIWCHSPEGISSENSIWHDNSICIACGQCVKACPNSALQINKNSNSIININRSGCILSGECVRVCPTGAIRFTGYKTYVHEVLDEIRKDLLYYVQSWGGVTLTGGEPLYQPEFTNEVLAASKAINIHTAIETCLYCDRNIVDLVTENVDLFIIDMKIFDNKQHLGYTGKSNDIIKDNFEYIARSGKEILIRIPLVPGITDSADNLESIEKYVHGIDNQIHIEHIDYNPLAGNNYKKLGIPFTNLIP